jgi:hypothetical protein
VYAVLAYSGRRSVREIIQRSNLSVRHVKSSLVILVQHLLVLHHTESGQTYYTANGDTAYNVAFRFGKMARMARERLGEPAAEVLHKVAALGHVRVGHLVDNFFAKKDHEPTEVNGVDEGQKVKSAYQLHRILDQLLHSGFLCVVTKQAYMTEYDIGVAAEQTEYERLQGRELKNAKDKKAFRADIEKRKRKWRDDAHSHAMEGGEPDSKRRRIAFLISSGLNPKTHNDDTLDDGFRLSDDICVRVNYEKCAVIMRNEQLVEFAHRYIGETTSKVYAALLRCVEREWPRCYDPMDPIDELYGSDEPPASHAARSTLSVLNELDPALDIGVGIPAPPAANGVNGYLTNGHAQASDQRQRQVEAHLALLAADPRGFVVPTPSPSGSQHQFWTVPFKRLTRALQFAALSRTARTTAAGNPSPSDADPDAAGGSKASSSSAVPPASPATAAGVFRALHSAPPLGAFRDDRAIAAACVLPPRAARAAAARLARAGLVARQDIPRAHAPPSGGASSARGGPAGGGGGGASTAVASAAAAVAAAGGAGPASSSRTLVLVAAAPQLARATVVARCVRALVRLRARARAEAARGDVARAREKSERSDVRGREAELLAPLEREALGRWRAARERVAAAEARLDDLVACMRDFGPAGDAFVGPGTAVAATEPEDDGGAEGRQAVDGHEEDG